MSATGSRDGYLPQRPSYICLVPTSVLAYLYPFQWTLRLQVRGVDNATFESLPRSTYFSHKADNICHEIPDNAPRLPVPDPISLLAPSWPVVASSTAQRHKYCPWPANPNLKLFRYPRRKLWASSFTRLRLISGTITAANVITERVRAPTHPVPAPTIPVAATTASATGPAAIELLKPAGTGAAVGRGETTT